MSFQNFFKSCTSFQADKRLVWAGVCLGILCVLPLVAVQAASVDTIKKKVEGLDRKQYEIMGFYPGMPRAEAFEVAGKLSGGKIKSMDESIGIFYMQRTPEHLKITVNFPSFEDGAGNGWDEQTIPASKITIETKLPGDKIVVADEIRGEMVKKYGEPNIADMGNRVGFSPVETGRTDTAISQECRQTMTDNGQSPTSKEVREATSRLTDTSFAFMQEHCPHLVDDFVAHNMRQLGPLFNVHYTPGQKYVTYYMDYKFSERFSAWGEKRCQEHPGTC